MIIIIIAVAIIAIFLTIVTSKNYYNKNPKNQKQIKPKLQEQTPIKPYIKKEYIFTPSEYKFYKNLIEIIKDRNIIIFTKMRLADLVEVPKGTKEYIKWFNYIKAKHIDFILCDKENAKPILLIELDDYTHNQNKRKERDKFVDDTMNSAGYKIIHAKSTEDTEEIRRYLSI